MEVHVNAAMSVDGKLSTRHRDQVTISGPNDFDRVAELRRTQDGILVGVGTILADDPALTVDPPESTPTRIVADTDARTPTDATVLDDRAPTIVLIGESAPPERVSALEAAGATTVAAGTDRVDLSSAFATLETRGIESLLVEGGGELIFSLFDAGLVDTLTVYIGSVVIGGAEAPTLVDGTGFGHPDSFPQLRLRALEEIDDGILATYSTR